MHKKPVPIVVVDGTVLVATMGATVAAATGVTGLKMGFCAGQNVTAFKCRCIKQLFMITAGRHQEAGTCVMV